MNKLIESESLQLSIASLQLGAVSKLQQITHDLVISGVKAVNHGGCEVLVQLPEITLMEVSSHDCLLDCWIVIYDRVYNVTKFMERHPGGRDVILEYAGRDASLAFRGTGHSLYALKLLKEFEIGELPHSERIFRCSGKLIAKDLPL